MLNYILKEPKHESFYKKYASKKFLKVGVGYSPPPPCLISPLGQRVRAGVGARAVATRRTRPALGRPSRPERGDPSSKG